MDEIKIINLRQAILYIKNGVFPVRLETGKGNIGDILIFIFNTDDTKEVWEKWRKFELA